AVGIGSSWTRCDDCRVELVPQEGPVRACRTRPVGGAPARSAQRRADAARFADPGSAAGGDPGGNAPAGDASTLLPRPGTAARRLAWRRRERVPATRRR